MPDLTRLTLDQAEDITDALIALCAAGHILVLKGFRPEFDLKLGEAPLIRLCRGEAASRSGDAPDIDIKAFVDAVMADVGPAQGAGARDDSGAVCPPPAPHRAGACADVAAPVAPAAELTAGAMPDDTDTPDTPDGDVATTTTFGREWTAHDDQTVIGFMNDAAALGDRTKTDAYRAIALILGRTARSIENRWNKVLRDRSTETPAPEQTASTPPAGARTAAGEGVAAPAPAAPVVPAARKIVPPVARPVPRQSASHAAPVKPAAPGVLAHLGDMVYPFGPWTFEKDFDLLRLVVECGWPVHEVALELQVSSTQLTQRTHKLTDGKRFAMRDLWEAVQTIAETHA